MRRMDLAVAGVLAVLSAYFMWKSTELPIGWIKEYGPGGGAFPFYLSLGMLISSLLILVRSLRGLTPESRSESPFFVDAEARRLVYTVVAALTAMVAIVSGVWVYSVPIVPALGVYVAVPLFIIFYMRHLGRHSWFATVGMAVAVPVVTFLFFEKLLLILLPKGLTDTWFYIFF
jgi:putative tricarboxylic transport membrane protein